MTDDQARITTGAIRFKEILHNSGVAAGNAVNSTLISGHQSSRVVLDADLLLFRHANDSAEADRTTARGAGRESRARRGSVAHGELLILH